MTSTTQDALSTIMELCETKLNENDYLIVAGQLKIVYNDKFAFTNDEKNLIIHNRMKLQIRYMIEDIMKEMETITEDLVEVRQMKKEAWDWAKISRYSYSPDRESSVIEHKHWVQKEKELKAELNQLKTEMKRLM